MTPCNILIVDDDEVDVKLISTALKSVGDIHLHHVSTTKEAYQYLEAVPANSLPRLMVVDMFLLDSIGAAFVLELQAQETYKDIQAVILSSSNQEYTLKQFPQLKVDYMQKPSDRAGYKKIAAQIMGKL